MLHEQQYQQSPPFIFLPQRPHVDYSSPWLKYYYQYQEMRLYATQRIPRLWVLAVARKIATWWSFYCGVLISVSLFLPALLRRGKIRILQVFFLSGMITLPFLSQEHAVVWRLLVDALFILEIVVLWQVFADFWQHLAIGTGVLLLCEAFLVKWSFPHYFAPAACLVLYLETAGLRTIWEWNPSAEILTRPQSRHERRRLVRESKTKKRPPLNLRGLVYLLPIACLISLIVRIEARAQGWNDNIYGPERDALLSSDWSLCRSQLEHWLQEQPTPQLVFVQYSANHDVNAEWVYNHADLMRSHVIWARDLGSDHNRLLLQEVPNRTVWFLQADSPAPELIPYGQLDKEIRLGNPPNIGPVPKTKQLNW